MNNNLSQSLSFLVIGGGSIGRRHIQNLQQLGYNNIYCLKRNNDQDFQLKLNVKVVTSITQLPQKIDIVFVCTPTSLHVDGLLIAKELDAAVFIEKPLTHDLINLQQSIEVANQNHNLFFIGFMLRYHPLVLKIKELLEQKHIGEIYSGRFSFGSYLPNWHPWENHQESYASQKRLGGGVINTITHELDLIQYFFGDPIAVVAEKANYQKLNIEVEEVAEAIFTYENKLVTLHLDYLQKEYDRTILLLGDNGSIKWNWHENKVIVKIHEQDPIEFTSNKDDVNQLYIEEVKHFIALYQHKQFVHPLNLNHAIANTQLMLAMHVSAEQGHRINLTKNETNK